MSVPRTDGHPTPITVGDTYLASILDTLRQIRDRLPEPPTSKPEDDPVIDVTIHKEPEGPSFVDLLTTAKGARRRRRR